MHNLFLQKTHTHRICIRRFNNFKRIETVMRHLATSRGRDYNKRFLPKPVALNAPAAAGHSATRKRREPQKSVEHVSPSKPANKRPSLSPPATPTPSPAIGSVSLPDTPSSLCATPGTTPPDMRQDPIGLSYEEEYGHIDDAALIAHMSSDDSVLVSPSLDAAEFVPSQESPKSKCGVPASASSTHTPDTLPSSFPSSPPPTLTSTPSPSPHIYTNTTYVPRLRDFALDYEAVMIAVGDLNRHFRSGRIPPQTPSSSSSHARNADDVIPILSELRDMLNRLFTRRIA